MEIRNWEKRNSDIAYYQINLELESQRLQVQQAIQWADQAQREKVSLCGELEMRNSLFRENRAKDCQEIEELRRVCCEETDRARQARIDELSLHQERNPTTVRQLLTQIQDVQNKVNSLSDARDFWRSWNSKQLWSIPRSQPTLDYSESRNNAAWYTEYYGHFRKRFSNPTCSRRTILSSLFENSRNLASASCGLGSGNTVNIMEHGRRVRREPQSSSIPTPRFNQCSNTTSNPLHHTEGICF